MEMDGNGAPGLEIGFFDNDANEKITEGDMFVVYVGATEDIADTSQNGGTNPPGDAYDMLKDYSLVLKTLDDRIICDCMII
jgi:hypothetical protein